MPTKKTARKVKATDDSGTIVNTISPVNTVSVQKDLQKTLPSRPLTRSFPRAEMGDSGTRILHGIITEEYNPEIQGIEGIKVFDQMRKNDGTVRAAMLSITLPIRRAQWFINAATDDPKDDEIRSFVEHALFDWIEDMSWDDIIRQALLMTAFGVMLFEKVYGTYEHEGKTYVTVKKLAPRLPKSILMWELVDRTFGIQQIRQDGVLAQIPGSKLLIFVNEREGDNWWGTSMLRGAYKHWVYKDGFYKMEAVGFERQSIGVPMVKMPIGYTESDEKKATTAMQNLRANEKGYLVLPNGYEAEFMNMGGQSTLKPADAIEHHNKEILQSVLAQFLELGAARASSGSRALSQDHSDLFLKALEGIANTIISVFNKDLIPELVDMNFDNVTVYPVLDYSGIIKADVAALGQAYSQLVTAGAINPTDDDQQYIRAALGLPPRTQEDIDAQDDEDPSSEELIDHADIEEEPDSDTPPGPMEDEGDTTPPPTQNTKQNKNKTVENASKKTTKKAPTADQNKKTDTGVSKKVEKKKAHEHFALKRKFDDGNGFMSWRPLTMAEQKVDLKKIDDTLDEIQSSFSKEAKDLLNKSKDSFMAKVLVALNNNDTKAVSALEVSFVADYKTLLKTYMNRAYNLGKNTASNEMDIEVPPSTATSMANIDLMADTIATKTASDIESKAKLSIANSLKTDATSLQTAGSIDSDLEDAIEKTVDTTAGLIAAQSMNAGRNDVFQRNVDSIYALQRSEILDDLTCNFCLSMDGLVIEATDPWSATEIYHGNCRGIWVEIMKDEANPPEITGVPENIAKYYEGQPNALQQPSKPITREGTLADKYVKDRDAREE